MRMSAESQDAVIIGHLSGAVGDLVAVYRFGSTANGTSSATSDIDVAVLAQTRLTPERRFEIQEALAEKLGCDVDLVDLAAASTVMAMQVVANGTLLYEAAGDARGLFEDYTFSAYARLNEERRSILDRVRAEGSVYGR
jgi:predicted nucleotidyltransferase